MSIDIHSHFLPRSVVESATRGERWHELRFDVTPQGDVVLNSKGETFQWGQGYWQPLVVERQDSRAQPNVRLVSITGPLLGYLGTARHAGSVVRDVNDELAELAKRDGILGLATLPLQDEDAAVAELDRAIHTLGFAGVAVGGRVGDEDWDAQRLFPILDAAARARCLFFMHPDPWGGAHNLKRYRVPNVIGQMEQMTMGVASLVLGGVLDRLPDLAIGVAQAGGFVAFAAGRLDRAHILWRGSQMIGQLPSDYMNRFFYDCMTFSAASLKCLIDTVGVNRVVLGTDEPSPQSLRSPAEWLRTAGLSEREVRMVMDENLRNEDWIARRTLSSLVNELHA